MRLFFPVRVVLAVIAAACAGMTPASAQTTLLDAAKAKNTEAIRAALKRGPARPGTGEVNARQADGTTALHWAAHWDDLDAADLLLAAGADINAANDYGATPLWIACENGSAPMVEKLLKAGANPNRALTSGETPLMTAARSGRVQAVKLLVAHRADVDVRERLRDQTALMWAAAQQHPDVVQALLEAGADVNARSASRRRLVSTAGNADYSGVIEVEEGGFTPLLFAARQGDVESARLLLGAGANVNDAAPSGTSALVVAAHSGHTALANFLLDKGADPNAAAAGYAALHIAVHRGDVALVRSLVAHGADPNALITQGSPGRRVSSDVILSVEMIGATPLWIAAREGRLEILRVLGGAGGNPAIDKDGTTPLMAAIGSNEQRSLETVRALLELAADINAADLPGNTALHLAAARGFGSIVRLLIDSGARVDVRNRRGQTPLAFASSQPREGGRPAAKDPADALDLLRKLSAKQP